MPDKLLRDRLIEALGPDRAQSLLDHVAMPDFAGDPRMAELDAMIARPGPSARPGVFIDGQFRTDRDGKQAWMRERNWRKPQRMSRGHSWRPTLRPLPSRRHNPNLPGAAA